MRRRRAVSAHGSYSRAKSAGAQFKELQNGRAKFLQNFCFYPGARRGKILEVMSNGRQGVSPGFGIEYPASVNHQRCVRSTG
jgi:hypothetical protein